MLGSQSEAVVFTADGIDYRPAGAVHAVDRATVDGSPLVLAYALCGQPVRVWAEHDFDPAAATAHEDCIWMACGAPR